MKICEILGTQDSLLDEIREKLPRLAPFRTGSFGQLLEWHEEYEEPEPGHRHISHYMDCSLQSCLQEMKS